MTEKTIEIKTYTPDMPLEGLIIGVPNDVYHAAPDSISKSGLDLVNRSPAHYFFAEDKPSSRAMQLGTALHAAILEPELFASSYMLLKDVTDRRTSIYKEAVKIHGSDNVLISTEADYVAGMQESVYSNEKAKQLIKNCEYKEISVFATCPKTGVNVRIRLDGLSIKNNYAIDLKTARDSSPDEFSKAVYNYRYHVQDAFYRYVYFLATGIELDFFEFIAVESDIPHPTMPYKLDDISRSIGKAEYERNLNTAAECIKNNHWPAYTAESDVISIPEWAIMRHEAENNSDIVIL